MRSTWTQSRPIESSGLRLLLGQLNGVRGGPDGQYVALCPAHEDHSPSLSIAVGRDGRILITCHAGCRTIDVLRALDLCWNDLFATTPRRKRP